MILELSWEGAQELARQHCWQKGSLRGSRAGLRTMGCDDAPAQELAAAWRRAREPVTKAVLVQWGRVPVSHTEQEAVGH